MKTHLYNIKNQMSENEIFLCFSGPLTHDILMSLGETLKYKIKNDEKKIKLYNNVFSIFVEQVENIIRYSDEKLSENEKMASNGIIAIGKNNKNYFIISGNHIINNKIDSILNKLNIINDMSKDELKVYYKEKRRFNTCEESKGAGIGLIEIARKSSKKIEYDIKKLDDNYSFFTIKAVI